MHDTTRVTPAERKDDSNVETIVHQPRQSAPAAERLVVGVRHEDGYPLTSDHTVASAVAADG
jgi:hypothetical protein